MGEMDGERESGRGKEPMTDLPKLNESDIRRWIGGRSFERGQGYFQRGHIVNPRRQGNTLKARCLGSRSQPYHVETTLGPEGIVVGQCSCPVGTGGHCKHAAALLLTWLHQPDAFLVMEELEEALNRRSKADLIALIRRMVARYPDLEMLLELPVVGDAGATPPLDPEVIRRQVNSVLHSFEYDGWATTRDIAQQLQELVDIGDDYAGQGNWRDAATVYQTVAQEVLDSYGVIQGEEGELGWAVEGCVTGLGQCLAETDDTGWRETLLRALFDIYRWDVNYGGIGMGGEVPDIILREATAEEKQQVAGWVREALPEGDSWSRNYHRRVYGGFLLALEEEQLDDEAFLQVCRETNRWHDLVNRLLDLDRVDEAAAAARELGDYELLQVADIFVAHSQADLVERLIRERVHTSQAGPEGPARRDTRLTVWLKERAQARGDLAEALTLAETLFWQYPDVRGYQELRELARLVERWDELRAAILTRLTDAGKHHLLTEIYLEDGDVDRALETLEQMRIPGWRGELASSALRIQVARAAEGSRPRAAIRIYVEKIERLIAARGRGNYAQAATYLVRVRDLYHRLGDPTRWATLISSLREENPRLRALKEELDKAGL